MKHNGGSVNLCVMIINYKRINTIFVSQITFF